MTELEKRQTVHNFVNRFPGKTIIEIETLIGSVIGISAVDKLGLKRDEIGRQLQDLKDGGQVFIGTCRHCTKAPEAAPQKFTATWWPL